MENLNSFIVDLALMLAVAGCVTILFKKINQPLVLGYIVAGFLISPNFVWLPTVMNEANIDTWAEIGIIFLMFALGLEFSFHNIAKVGGSAVIIAVVVMGSMIVIGYMVGQFLGWARMDSIFLGGMISMSSTMIILKAYDELNLKNEAFARLTLGVLVIEDIAGIFMMIILTAISVSKKVSGIEMAGQIGMLLLVLVVILCVGIYVIPSFLKRVRNLLNDETLMIVSIGICFVMVVICSRAGFSEALGAFLAGSILAGTESGERIEELVKSLKDLFGAVFFISVGMLIVPDMLIKYLVPILIITVITIFGQMMFSSIGALASGQPLDTSVRVGFSMVQIGEFSFIIASLGTSLGVTGDFLYPIVVCVSVITTFTTPIFIKRGQWAYKKIYRMVPNRVRAFMVNYTSEKQTDNVRDNDWARYFKKYFVKLVTGTAILLAIYTVGLRYIEPYINEVMDMELLSDILSLIIVMALMVPVINMICTKRSLLFNKLWLKNRANILPLLTLRAIAISVSALFTVLVIEAMFISIPLPIAILLSLVVIAVSMKSSFIKGRSVKLQTRFLANFNEKILNNARKDRDDKSNPVWVDEVLYVFSYKLNKIYKRKYIRDFTASRVFGVMLISILREDGTRIHLPKAGDKMQEGDILFAMGSKEQVEAYIVFLQKTDYIVMEEPNIITLREYLHLQEEKGIPPEERLLCAALPIEKGSEFARKHILESGFVDNYEGIIIGVERELLPIVSPNKDFLIIENDIMWVLGAQKMVDAMICKGLLA